MAIKAIVLRSAFNYDADAVSSDTGLSIDPKESVTQQQFRDECDINTIVERFGLTGQLPENLAVPVSGDFTGVSDFASAMLAVRQAQESFMLLPAEVRARFANDPQRLIEFLDDGRNADEALKLGLVKPKPEVTRDVVQAVDELAQKFTGALSSSSKA